LRESYPESNVIDNDVNYESRWSTSNESAVNLTIELETTSTVSSMDIAWGRGDKTVYEFEIYAREGTNGDWTKVYDNLSSGEANKLETFNLIDIEAKQIRIKSFGNDSGNGITDIKEVKIYGPGKL